MKFRKIFLPSFLPSFLPLLFHSLLVNGFVKNKILLTGAPYVAHEEYINTHIFQKL